MKPKINYHYIIPYKPLSSFEFIPYTNTITVDETCYYYRIVPRLPGIIEELRTNLNSRQQVIMTNNNINNACLISLQFLVVKNRLVVIANFRSQCRINGRPNDTNMLRYFATLVTQGLNLKRFKIYCNVGNYHDNLGEKNNYGMN